MKYIKKPVVIEAWQWLFNAEQEEPPTWVTNALNKWPHVGGIVFEPDCPGDPRILICTLEGVMKCSPKDWIIQGIKGELYPCKPDIFEATYKEVS